jgi:NitT/TauT family transport system substrate-binding protein
MGLHRTGGAMGALAMLARSPARRGAGQGQSRVFPWLYAPLFRGVERGFFKEQNIETEMVRLIGSPPNVAAMITNQIDASAVLVTIEE